MVPVRYTGTMKTDTPITASLAVYMICSTLAFILIGAYYTFNHEMLLSLASNLAAWAGILAMRQTSIKSVDGKVVWS